MQLASNQKSDSKETKVESNLERLKKAKNKGIVLGGGGAKGCYHVGLWQAFKEQGIDFQALSGTSIGALVGAFYVQKDIVPVTHFVMDMQPTEIATDLPALPITFKEKIRGGKTVLEFIMKYMDEKMDITPLKEHFRQMFDYDAFSSSDIRYACMTYNDSLQEPRPFFKNEITADNAEEIILASASCYPAFPKMKIGEDYYIDGGYADNVPVSLLQELDPDLDLITVVDIHNPEDPTPPALREDMIYIQPLLNPGNSLDFTQDHAMSLYDQGYLEGMKYLDIFPGYLYTFPADDIPLIDVVEQYLDRQMEQNQVVLPDRASLEQDALSSLLGYRPFELKNERTRNYHYGKLVEALALLARINPVGLYDYTSYLARICEALSELKISQTEANDYRVMEMFSNLKREELPLILHRILVHNGGKFPQAIEKLKDRFAISYTLAYVWYFIEELVRSLQSIQKKNDPEMPAETAVAEQEDLSHSRHQATAQMPEIPDLPEEDKTQSEEDPAEDFSE